MTVQDRVNILSVSFIYDADIVARRPSSVNPLSLYMRTQPRNGFTSSHTTHTIHATGSRAKLSTFCRGYE